MARPIIPVLEAPAMMLSSLMSTWLIHLSKVEGYSASTIENYERTKLQFLAYLRAAGRRDEIESFTDAACSGFVDDLGSRGVGVNTIVNKLAALSSFAVYGMRARNARGRPWFATNPTKAFKWPQTRKANIPIITPDEVHRFLALPLNGGKAIIRDLFFDTGLRVSEIAEANAEDLLKVGEAWFLEATVKSRGRQRRRQFPVSPDVGARLRDYLSSRAPLKPGAPLVVRRDGQRYMRSHLGRLITLLGQAAGITRVRMSPHKIRHMVNVWGRLGGADVLSRSALLGHSSPQSIQSYEHVLDHELHEARAQQREGLRRYLAGVESPICATPVNAGGIPQAPGAKSPVFMRSGDDSGPERTLWNMSYLTRGCTDPILLCRANQFHNGPGSILCRCGCSAVDHDLIVTADDRLVGRCLWCGACEGFEPT